MSGTLIVAILGLVLSVASIVWQLASYVLDGARIAMQFSLGRSEPLMIAIAQPGHFQLGGTKENPYSRAECEEIVKIEVRNRGRGAATVVSVGLTAARRTRKWFRRNV